MQTKSICKESLENIIRKIVYNFNPPFKIYVANKTDTMSFYKA